MVVYSYVLYIPVAFLCYLVRLLHIEMLYVPDVSQYAELTDSYPTVQLLFSKIH